jgi:hypothetical protein
VLTLGSACAKPLKRKTEDIGMLCFQEQRPQGLSTPQLGDLEGFPHRHKVGYVLAFQLQANLLE